jgi:hypothetical protein
LLPLAFDLNCAIQKHPLARRLGDKRQDFLTKDKKGIGSLVRGITGAVGDDRFTDAFLLLDIPRLFYLVVSEGV